MGEEVVRKMARSAMPVISRSLLKTVKKIDYSNFSLAIADGINRGVNDLWLDYRQSIFIGSCLSIIIVFALLYLTIKLAMIDCDCRHRNFEGEEEEEDNDDIQLNDVVALH